MTENTRPARKSFVARHKILTAVGAVIAVIIVVQLAGGGGSSDGEGSAGDVTQADAGTEGGASDEGGASEGDPDAGSADDTVAGLGTPVRDGQFEFVVTEVEAGVPSIGSSPLSQDAQGQFVVVRLTVTNIGDQAQTFDQSSQEMVDTQGRQLASDPTAGIYLDDQNFLTQINPGNSVEGVVVFDIPADAVPATLELHDSFLSDGVTVTL